MKINVQQLSGAEPTSFEVQAQATLQDLRSIISRAEASTFSLVLGEQLLRDEFNTEGSRWKHLAEYGIVHGATLGLIQQAQRCEGAITIAAQPLSGGSIAPIEIDAAATLEELEAIIREREGLSPDARLSLSLLGKDFKPIGVEISSAALGRGRSLAEHGIESGTSLGWRARGIALSDITNFNGNAIFVKSAVQPTSPSNTGQPFLGIGRGSPDRHCISPDSALERNSPWQRTLDNESYWQCTPVRNARPVVEHTPLACKERRTRELKRNKMLKRL